MGKGKKKKTKKQDNRLNKKILTNGVMGYFFDNPQKVFNYKQIASHFNIKDEGVKNQINAILIELRDEGTIVEISRGKYKYTPHKGYITGKVELTQKGAGFIISEESEEDIFVTQSNLNHALNGDIVKVHLFAKQRGRKPEGEVIEIIQRANKQIVGVIEISKNFAFLVSPSRQMPYDIFIPINKIMNAQNGDKVVVKITDWPAKHKNPFGEVVEVLGDRKSVV